MCRRVSCNKCGRPTYAGCGQHIEQVLGDVSPADRCKCREKKAVRENDAQAGSSPFAWLRKLLAK